MDNLTKRRHSIAHLLGAAVVDIDKDAKLVYGPPTDDGFFYDVKTRKTFTEDDMSKITKKMQQILPSWDEFTQKELEEKDARELFGDNKYKKSFIDQAVKNKEKITAVWSGDFVDLCAGGHIDSMKKVSPKSFIIDRISASHWGDETKPSLTRIYGFAFETDKELEDYLHQRKEAKKRDHRKIAKEMDLFSFSDYVGPGLPLFSPRGAAMREALTDKIDVLLKKYGYEKVWIPHIAQEELYKKSGHLGKYDDDLIRAYGKNTKYVMKAMNCPHHIQIFDNLPKSYKDLPVRYAEHTTTYRDEQSGELLGLTRVISITQDDGHIFCTPDQIKQEIKSTINLVKDLYTALGMFKKDCYEISLSIRDPKTPEKYIGETSVWEKAEKDLEEILIEEKLPFKKEEGEAAFYGPKIDFIFYDAIKRPHQLSTIQLDFNLPERFELKYIDKDGKAKQPIMIHRAIAGSVERFLGVMIEHFAGVFPFWLAPEQLRILPVSKQYFDYAYDVNNKMKTSDIRSSVDAANISLGKRLYAAKKLHTPYIAILGEKNVKNNTITLQSRDTGKEITISIQKAIEKLTEENLIFPEEKQQMKKSLFGRLFG